MKRVGLLLLMFVQITNPIHIKETNLLQLGAGTICSIIGLVAAHLTVKHTKEFINNFKQEWRLQNEIYSKGARINWRFFNCGNYIERCYELDMAQVKSTDKDIIEQYWKQFQKVKNDQNNNQFIGSFSFAFCAFLVVGPLLMYDSIYPNK